MILAGLYSFVYISSISKLKVNVQGVELVCGIKRGMKRMPSALTIPPPYTLPLLQSASPFSSSTPNSSLIPQCCSHCQTPSS